MCIRDSQTDFFHLGLQGCGLILKRPHFCLRGGQKFQGLVDHLPAGRLGQGKDAVILHLGRDLILDLRFNEQQNTAAFFFGHFRGKRNAKIIGQGRIDNENIEYSVYQEASGLSGRGNGQNRRKAAGGQQFREQLIGLLTGRDDQDAVYTLFLNHKILIPERQRREQ